MCLGSLHLERLWNMNEIRALTEYKQHQTPRADILCSEKLLCWSTTCRAVLLCALCSAYNAELQLKRLKHTLPLHLPFSIKLSVKMLYTKGSLWFNMPSLRYHWKWPHWFKRSLQEAFCCKHGWAELWATLVSWWGLCPAHWEVGSRDWHCISAVCPVLRLCRKWQGPKLCFT